MSRIQVLVEVPCSQTLIANVVELENARPVLAGVVIALQNEFLLAD